MTDRVGKDSERIDEFLSNEMFIVVFTVEVVEDSHTSNLVESLHGKSVMIVKGREERKKRLEQVKVLCVQKEI